MLKFLRHFGFELVLRLQNADVTTSVYLNELLNEEKKLVVSCSSLNTPDTGDTRVESRRTRLETTGKLQPTCTDQKGLEKHFKMQNVADEHGSVSLRNNGSRIGSRLTLLL